MEQQSKFRRMIHERFDKACKGRLDADDLIWIIAAAEEDGLEPKVEAYLGSHPEATIRETAAYMDSICPEVEIEFVDDDLLEDGK